MPSNISIQTVQRGVYRHYKGQQYVVIGGAFHTETQESMVLYTPLSQGPDSQSDPYGAIVFARPYAMFVGSVIVNGESVPRFMFISPQIESQL